MKRVYHHYLKWEETSSGMWDRVDSDSERELLARAIEFTGDAALYGSYMQRVITEWPISCEQNLTNCSMNQLAWVGHAAVAIAFRCPEYITRAAWRHLSEEQRIAADAEAMAAVREWRTRYRERAQDGFSFTGKDRTLDTVLEGEGV